jgi:hypothetical protein
VPNQGVIANVSLYEEVQWILHDRSERIKIPGVGQLIEVDNTGALSSDELPYKTPSNETGTTCHQYRVHPEAFYKWIILLLNFSKSSTGFL